MPLQSLTSIRLDFNENESAVFVTCQVRESTMGDIPTLLCHQVKEFPLGFVRRPELSHALIIARLLHQHKFLFLSGGYAQAGRDAVPKQRRSTNLS